MGDSRAKASAGGGGEAGASPSIERLFSPEDLPRVLLKMALFSMLNPVALPKMWLMERLRDDVVLYVFSVLPTVLPDRVFALRKLPVFLEPPHQLLLVCLGALPGFCSSKISACVGLGRARSRARNVGFVAIARPTAS